MKTWIALLSVCIVFLIAAGVLAGEQDLPPGPGPENESAEPGEREWTPPTEKELEKLEKAEKKKLEAKLIRWRRRMEDAGMTPAQIEQRLAEAKRQWKRDMQFKIELAKMPPDKRDETIVERRLEGERARLEREGVSGETLEQELAKARDRIEIELREQHRIDALPRAERVEHLLRKQEEHIRARLSESGLQGEELEQAVKRNMEFYRQEIEKQVAGENIQPGNEDAVEKPKKKPKKPKLNEKDLAALEKLAQQWKGQGLSDEDIEKRSAHWKRQRLLEKANPGLAAVNALRKDVQALQKQLKAATRRLADVNRQVRRQSAEIAEMKKLLEEIRKGLFEPDWEEPFDPGEPEPLPEPPPVEPEKE